MVVVKIAETYDLNTKANSVGLIGVHSPSAEMIAKMWPGFFQNYKFVRVLSGNITCACASYLPADPLQVGVTTGKVAPQDMFNPILYKAVSNDSFENVVSTLYSYISSDQLLPDGTIVKRGIYPGDQSDPDNPNNQWSLYYGLLAQPGWKKAMPQAGFGMRGLRPLVHMLASTFGNVSQPQAQASPNLNSIYGETTSGTPAALTGVGRVIRGRAFPMPRMPTKVPQSGGVSNFAIPPAWCACIIVPPSKLNSLYYRMRVVWSIEFSVPRSIQSIGTYSDVGDLGRATYYNGYDSASKNMENVTDSIDTIGVDIEKVMEQ